MNYKQCAELLLKRNDILIVTHKNPDGDTAGSAAALCSVLRRAGKTAYLYANPQFSRRLHDFALPFIAPESFVPSYIVTVDVAADNMLANGFEGKIDLCIDHHENSVSAPEKLVRTEKAACGEIVLDVVGNLVPELTEEEATWLYIALSTDTGCFCYSNTNPATFKAASELLRAGAENSAVNQKYFRKVSRARLALESLIFKSLEYYRDGKITVAVITREMMAASHATTDDLEDVANLAGRAEGSMLNITVQEKDDGTCRVSVRSVPGVNSREICAVLGGGGHENAAGCTIKASPEKTKEILLQVADEVWK